MLGLPLVPALLLIAPRSERFGAVLTAACSTCGFALSLVIVAALARGGVLVLIPHWLAIDSLSALMLGLVMLVSSTAAMYSLGYVGAEHSSTRTRLYYANFNLFVLSMLSIPLMVELGLVWIAVELTTLLSVLLVSFAGTNEALEAAWKYMLLTLLGATVAVLGILVLFWALKSSGSTDFSFAGLQAAAHGMPVMLVKIAFVLILVGYGAKVGLVPLHTWLPDAHSQAPSPVCALLSGIETSVVLYVLLRLRSVFLAVPAVHVQTWFAAAGLISVGIAVLLIVQTHDFKRLFAFSTVEHMGIVLTAASFATPIGDTAVVWQMFAHTLTKSFCFYGAGSVLLVTGTRSISAVRGLIAQSRSASAALIIGALAISGAPPFAVFLSELAVLRAGILAGHYVMVALLGTFIAIGFFGVLFHVVNMISGSPKAEDRPHRLPMACRFALGMAAVPVLLFGVWIPVTLLRLLLASGAVLRI